MGGPVNKFFNKFDGEGIEVNGDSFEVIMPPFLFDIVYIKN